MRVLRASTKRPLNLLALGRDGRVAAASSAYGVRGEVELWDAPSGTLLFRHTADEREARALSFTPDGRHLVISASRSIEFVDTANARVAAEVKPDLAYPVVSLSPDGTRLLATESLNETGEIECWSVKADLSCVRLWHAGLHGFCWFNQPAISPNGDRVAVSQHIGYGDRVQNSLQVRDGETGKVSAEIEFGASNPLEQIAFSADGSKVLARSSGRTVKVFDAATGQPAGELIHPGRPYVTGMAVHPSGAVACCRTNGTVCLWNLERLELVRTLDWKLGKLVSVAFSPDGSIAAAGTEDGQVIVWDVDA